MNLAEDDGTYLAFARFCDVEDHIWAGFRMDEHMQDYRYAFVTVYFSQGGAFTNINKSWFHFHDAEIFTYGS